MFPQLSGSSSNPSSPWANTKGLNRNDLTQVGSIATQNLGGNSLTQMMRSLQNYLATQGQSTFDWGQGITSAALPGFGAAGDTTGTALGTTNAALKTLDPAESYWSKLLSGDQATMNQAIAPYASQAGTNYANLTSSANMNMPRGGYSAVFAAGAPQALARDVNNQLFSLQPTAATNLNTIAGTKNAIAGTQGNIAGVQAQIANWLASMGIDVSKLGAGFLDSAMTSLLQGRGQDVGEHNAAMQLAGQTAGDLTSGINTGMQTAKRP